MAVNPNEPLGYTFANKVWGFWTIVHDDAWTKWPDWNFASWIMNDFIIVLSIIQLWCWFRMFIDIEIHIYIYSVYIYMIWLNIFCDVTRCCSGWYEKLRPTWAKLEPSWPSSTVCVGLLGTCRTSNMQSAYTMQECKNTKNWSWMGVSKNMGTPKWMIYNGNPY